MPNTKACHQRAIGLSTINLHTEFKVSISSCYEDMKGDTKCRKLGALGQLWVTQGHYKINSNI